MAGGAAGEDSPPAPASGLEMGDACGGFPQPPPDETSALAMALGGLAIGGFSGNGVYFVTLPRDVSARQRRPPPPDALRCKGEMQDLSRCRKLRRRPSSLCRRCWLVRKNLQRKALGGPLAGTPARTGGKLKKAKWSRARKSEHDARIREREHQTQRKVGRAVLEVRGPVGERSGDLAAEVAMETNCSLAFCFGKLQM